MLGDHGLPIARGPSVLRSSSLLSLILACREATFGPQSCHWPRAPGLPVFLRPTHHDWLRLPPELRR